MNNVIKVVDRAVKNALGNVVDITMYHTIWDVVDEIDPSLFQLVEDILNENTLL